MREVFYRALLGAVLVVALTAVAFAVYPLVRSLWLRSQVLDSGGPLAPEQAAYDVRRIELAVRLDPVERRLDGEALTEVVSRAPLDTLRLDLDRRLRVASVAVDGREASFRHRRGRLAVELSPPFGAGERHAITVVYGGRPKSSPAPPWIDGFVWERTAGGSPWIGLVTQVDGADLWLPVKDHPSDEPDEGVALILEVPTGLVGLANGRRVEEVALEDGYTRSRWEVRSPINNYLLTVAAGPYVPVVERYRGADGSLDVPMTFWALPEHLEAAERMWREAPRVLSAFASRFGEFPFLDDKIAAVDAPYLGMEHQTLIGYGDDFAPDAFGFDETLVHELAHEWWGNKLSVTDWDDFWLQEGLSTWAESLWVEIDQGPERARAYLETQRLDIANRRPLVAGRPRTAGEAYGHDIYVKGAWVVASLRWTIGDEAFFRLLERFAAGPPRLVDGAELEALAARECACELGSFWDVYLRRAEPPVYAAEIVREGAVDVHRFAWDDARLPMPLPVKVAGRLVRVAMEGGRGELRVAADTPVHVETAGRLLARSR